MVLTRSDPQAASAAYSPGRGVSRYRIDSPTETVKNPLASGSGSASKASGQTSRLGCSNSFSEPVNDIAILSVVKRLLISRLFY